VFRSEHRYYELFHTAGISWNSTQKRNPKKDPDFVKKKHEITAWLEAHRVLIEAGELVVLFVDECDLLWGYVTGYVWSQTNQPLEVPIVNDRQRQTYYGALNYCTQEFLVKAYDKGNSGSTIEFLKEVQQQYPRATPCFVLGWCKRFLVHKKSKPICNWLIRTWQKTFGISPAHG
jgi:putative transposase